MTEVPSNKKTTGTQGTEGGRQSPSYQTLLAEFDSQSDLYANFADRTERLIKELLAAEGINVHSVTSRVKGRKSLEGKLRQSEHGYGTIAEVTDLSGVRVITYFEDDVDRVAALVDREFGIDVINSIDKRIAKEPDQFGYMSVHYIAGWSNARTALTQFKQYAGLWAEIQIRSILQHAWAEIEHDLGYKSAIAVPAPIRRSFARVSGLLETADIEFARIRNELAAFEADAEHRIKDDPDTVEVDQASLRAFIEGGGTVEYDRAIADSISIETILPEIESIDRLMRIIEINKVRSIGELSKLLRANGKNLGPFLTKATGYSGYAPPTDLSMGASIFHLGYLLIANKDRPQQIEYLHEVVGMRLGDDHETRFFDSVDRAVREI